MATKKSLSAWQRFCYKYRVSFVDEIRQEEWASYYLSGLKLALCAVAAIGVSMLLGVLLVVATPLRNCLPGYAEGGLRDKIWANTLQVDSLTQVVKLQDAYILNLQNVMQGTIPVDTACLNDSLLHRSHEEIIPVSEEEEAFREAYEQEQGEKMPPKTTVVRFTPPVSGRIVQTFNVAENRYGVHISVPGGTSVKAATSGVVLQRLETNKGEVVLEIQHPNQYLSVYRFIGQSFVERGAHLKGKEEIGTTLKGKQQRLTYELWQNGLPQNPVRYIKF